ncbi:MAG TPA: lytic transglycosylase domain-containing protein [Devosia sp.]|nr:lytic transglycosylase domain-containing protein [Devosia sp.]
MRRWGLVVLALLSGLIAPRAATPETDEPIQSCFALSQEQNICITEPDYVADVCTAISAYAGHWQLPEAFFARLIWQESRFDPFAISPAGAQGIAQFMPGTARLRRLSDPFDPSAALAKSAEYLRELELKYGNLGLAAAAYNAGENRISGVIAIGRGVPRETRAFVSIITGRPIDYWLGEAGEPVDYTLHPERDFHAACVDMASATPMPDFGPEPAGWQPWGVLIFQHASRQIVTQRFEAVQERFPDVLGSEAMMLITARNPNFGNQTRFSAMVGRQTRAEAQGLCTALLRAGGNCVVRKNGD